MPSCSHVRPALPAGPSAITAIFAHYVTASVVTSEKTPPGASQWRGRPDDRAERGLPFLVAGAGETVAGYALARPSRPKAAYRHTVEDSVYLAPQRTGRELGRLLPRALPAQCAKAGARQVLAVIADTAEPAPPVLHRSCGLTQAGRLREAGYQHRRRAGTLPLQRDLGPGRRCGIW